MGYWSRIITGNNLLDKTHIWSTSTELKGIYQTSDLRASSKFLIKKTPSLKSQYTHWTEEIISYTTLELLHSLRHELISCIYPSSTLKYFQHNPHTAVLLSGFFLKLCNCCLQLPTPHQGLILQAGVWKRSQSLWELEHILPANPRATYVRWGALVKRSMWHYGNLCKTH